MTAAMRRGIKCVCRVPTFPVNESATPAATDLKIQMNAWKINAKL